MGTTILDTSSLIALAIAQRDTETPNDVRVFWQQHGGIDEAIEAFVLYDDLLFDGPSVRRNAARLPQLNDLSQFGSPISEEGGSRERHTYQLLLERYLPFFAGAPVASIFVDDLHVGEWDIADLNGECFYPSAGWRSIAHEMTVEARVVAEALREQLRGATSTGVFDNGASTALLLRTLYYDCLQQCIGSDLVLHPLKGQLLGKIRRVMHRRPSLAAHADIPGRAILDRFDETVRQEFYNRREAWLRQHDLTYEIPLLTAYVLKKCTSWQDLFKVIEELRESKGARRFRKSLNQLLEANRLHKNDVVDEVLSELGKSADEWARSLSQRGPKKKITVGVPIPGLVLETDLEVPDRKLVKSTADGLLVFIHSLLVAS